MGLPNLERKNSSMSESSTAHIISRTRWYRKKLMATKLKKNAIVLPVPMPRRTQNSPQLRSHNTTAVHAHLDQVFPVLFWFVTHDRLHCPIVSIVTRRKRCCQKVIRDGTPCAGQLQPMFTHDDITRRHPRTHFLLSPYVVGRGVVWVSFPTKRSCGTIDKEDPQGGSSAMIVYYFPNAARTGRTGSNILANSAHSRSPTAAMFMISSPCTLMTPTGEFDSSWCESLRAAKKFCLCHLSVK